jgi:uncharacterized protein YjbJ (UPF0337 family)
LQALADSCRPHRNLHCNGDALNPSPARHTPLLTATGTTMNKDQIEGRLEQAKGKVAEVTGKVINNDKMEVDGKADQVSGKVQANFGDAKEAVKDKAKEIIDKV